MQEYLNKLDMNKIKINQSKPLIKMHKFLSFLTVPTKKSHSHLGYCNGWTLHYGENDLEISGGIVNGVEYLNTIQYKSRLDNNYNNYVNPFYLFEIMTDEGKGFFLDFYSESIEEKISSATKRADNAIKYKEELCSFWKDLRNGP